MGAFDLREVEFQSDGLRDSLTLAMAPELFYENLKREIAATKRSAQELVIVSLVLRSAEFSLATVFQERLIEIAFALRTGLREEDFFARISDAGFWVLLRAEEKAVPAIIKRWNLPYPDQISIDVLARADLNYQEWTRRVDHSHFR